LPVVRQTRSATPGRPHHGEGECFMTAQPAEEAATIEELDALEESGWTGELSDQRARRILGLPALRGDEKYLSNDEVRRRLGLPR
jgi:hypothetical protein